MPRQTRPFFSRRKKIIGGVLLLLLIVSGYLGYRQVCTIARNQIYQEIANLHDGTTEIGPVSVGLQSIKIDSIQLKDPQGNQWFQASNATIRLPLIAAIFNGDYRPRSITLDQPEIDLHLDEHGQITNTFNTGQDSNDLLIKWIHAKIAVHQPNRESLVIDGIHLELETGPSSVTASGAIDQLLGGNLKLDYENSNGLHQCDLAFDQIDVDTEKLKSLPVLPKDALKGLKTQGSLSGNLKVEFDAKGLKDYRAEIRPDLKSLITDGFDAPFSNLDQGLIIATPGKIELAGLHIDGLAGEHILDGIMKQEGPADWKGTFKMQTSHAKLEDLERALSLGFEMTGPVDFEANFGLEIDSESYEIDGVAVGSTRGFTIETLPSKKIDTTVKLENVRIYFAENQNGPNTSGFVKVHCTNNDQDLSRTFEALGKRYKVPVPKVEGQGRVLVDVVVPLDPTDRGEDFWADIKVDSDKMLIGTIPFRTFRSDMTLFPDRYRIHSANLVSDRDEAVDFGGTIHFVSDERVKVALDPSTIHAGLLSHYVDAKNVYVAGNLDLRGEIFADRKPDGGIHTHGTGNVRGSEIQVDAVITKNLNARLQINDTKLWIHNLESQIADGSFLADAELDLIDHDLKIQTMATQVNLGTFSKWFPGASAKVPAINGYADAQAGIQLHLGQAFDMKVAGSVVAANPQVDSFYLDEFKSEFKITEDGFRLEDLQIRQSANTLSQSIDLPVSLPKRSFATLNGFAEGRFKDPAWHATGWVNLFDPDSRILDRPLPFEFGLLDDKLDIKTESDEKIQIAIHSDLKQSNSTRIKGQLKQLDLARWLGQLAPDNQQLPLSGKVDTTFDLTGIDSAESLSGELQISGLNAKLEQLPTSDWQAKLQFLDGKTEFDLAGVVFEGNCVVHGNHDTAELIVLEKPVRAKIKLEKANLNSMLKAFKLPTRQPGLSGLVSLDGETQYDPSEPGNAHWAGKLQIEKLRADNRDLSSSATANVDWNHERVLVQELNASVGSGRVQGKLVWPFTDSDQGSLQVQVARVNIRSLSPFYPEIREQKIEGLVSGRLQGRIRRLGSAIRMNGNSQLSLKDGAIQEFEWAMNPSNFAWKYDPVQNRGTLATRNAKLKLIDGSMDSTLKLAWGDRLSFDFKGKARNINTRKLGSAAVAKRVLGQQGKLNGELRFSSSNFRSIKDVEGTFVGSVDQSQALQLPVLNSISPYVNRSQFSHRKFEEGRIHLDLRNSQVKVHQMSFADPFVQVMIEGNVRVDGQMNLSAIVHVGPNSNDPLQKLLKNPLLASSSPPVALIAQIDRLLADRLLFFKITGKFSHPRVQIETTKILRQETLKFILEKTYNLGGPPNSLLNRSTIRLR